MKTRTSRGTTRRLKVKDLAASKAGKAVKGGSTRATINPCFKSPKGGGINPCFRAPGRG